MIDATQLRIGNYLMPAEEEYRGQVFAIDAGDIKHIREGMKIYKYEPIPITPEILQACGFDYHGDEYWLPFCREYDDKTCHLIVGRLVDDPPGMYYFSVKVPSGTAAINNVYHLHQVQNIAHSLTGKELSYSPNTTVK